ncbi:MAG: PIN domain-containing protein [Desulforhopalus sp.]|nr:PIN domain-containing protein [Desulforhopalus sp.]
MMLLDTNFVSELMRPQPDTRVINWLDEQLENNLSISSITQAEIETGITILPNGQRKATIQTAATELLDTFEDRCYPFDCASAGAYAEVIRLSRLKGRPTTTEDAQIAAIALTYQMILATRNTTDFDFIDMLQLVNPWGASNSE